MLDQRELKERYAKYLHETGAKQAFIADKLGINRNALSSFKNDINYSLWDEHAQMLNDYIMKFNVYEN